MTKVEENRSEKIKSLNSDLESAHRLVVNLQVEVRELKDLNIDNRSKILELEDFKSRMICVNKGISYHLTRAQYVDSREEFFSSNSVVTARKVISTRGHVAGWALYRDDVPLFSSRGGLTVFKGLDAVGKFCSENGFKSFETEGL